MSRKSFVKNLNRFIEEVFCTAQCDGNFLERLLPSLLLVEILKTTEMFMQDRLLRVKHQTIGGCHSGPLIMSLRSRGTRSCRWWTSKESERHLFFVISAILARWGRKKQ